LPTQSVLQQLAFSTFYFTRRAVSAVNNLGTIQSESGPIVMRTGIHSRRAILRVQCFITSGYSYYCYP